MIKVTKEEKFEQTVKSQVEMEINGKEIIVDIIQTTYPDIVNNWDTNYKIRFGSRKLTEEEKSDLDEFIYANW